MCCPARDDLQEKCCSTSAVMWSSTGSLMYNNISSSADHRSVFEVRFIVKIET